MLFLCILRSPHEAIMRIARWSWTLPFLIALSFTMATVQDDVRASGSHASLVADWIATSS